MRPLSLPRHVVVFTLITMFAVSASAYRAEYFVRANGQRLGGSEICFYRAPASDNPQSYFFGSSDVRCFPADEVIDLPPGEWHFFGRHKSGWITSDDRAMSYSGPPIPERMYKAIDVDLVPAGALDFTPLMNTLAAGEHFAVYIPNSDVLDRPAAVLPLSRGETSLLVPADKPVLPVRVRDGRLREIGHSMTVSEAATIRVERLGPATGRVDVIAWIDVARESLGHDAAAVSSIVVTLSDASGTIHKPLHEIRDGRAADLSLVVFKDLEPGAGWITMTGDLWKPATIERKVEIGSKLVFIEEPLRAVPAAAVSIDWAVPEHGVRSSRRTCSEPATEPRPTVAIVRLLRCPALQGGMPASSVDVATCTTAYSIVAQAGQRSGVARFRGVAAGVYVAELRYGGLPPKQDAVEAKVMQETRQSLAIEPSRIFGTITRHGKPLEAEIRFGTGRSFSDAEGRYEAHVSSRPGSEAVSIVPCDGTPRYSYLPAEPIEINTLHDVELPANTAVVHVVDAAGRPIPDAEVGVVLTTDGSSGNGIPDFQFSGGEYRTDTAGIATVRSLWPGSDVRVCAVAPKYRWSCSQPLRMKKDERREITLSLRPKDGMSGRVAGAELTGGVVHFVQHDGVVTEWVPVAADGTFHARNVHSADEHLVLTSANQPLLATRFPAPGAKGDIEIRFPIARRRTFRITTAAPTPAHFFSLDIGGLRVPVDVLTTHLSRRGLMSMIQNGGPAIVSDVLETGPIRVSLSLEPIRADLSAADTFLLPQYRSTIRIQPLGSSDDVVFVP